MSLCSGKLAAIAVLLSGLAACAAPAERPDARATVTTSEFSRTVDVNGPMMAETPFMQMAKFYQLETHIDKQTRAATYVIEIGVNYDESPIGFRYATDDTAQPLLFVPIKRESFRGGGKVEQFDIVVPEASLHAHAVTGYRVQVSARDGTAEIFAITPAMIAAQFAGVAQALATMPSRPVTDK